MKFVYRSALAGVFAALALGTFAQNSAVTSAYSYMTDGDYDKAREYIDQAITHEKTMGKEKTWRYRGDIYTGIATSEDSLMRASVPNAIQIAMESYDKAAELDEKNAYEAERKMSMAQLNAAALNNGIAAFNAKDFERDSLLFEAAATAAGKLGAVDTTAYYNAALSADQAGNYDRAFNLYKKAAEYEYQGATMYLYMAGVKSRAGDEDAAFAVVEEGLKKYPGNKDLVIEQLNYYIRKGEGEKALANMAVAIENDPENKYLYFSKRSLEEEQGSIEAAEASYKSAIRVDPEYFDAYYNLGILYFNQGVEQTNAANEIEDNAKYEAARAEAKKSFEKARPVLEKAYEINSEDPNIVAALTQMYAQLGETELYNEFKAKIGQ